MRMSSIKSLLLLWIFAEFTSIMGTAAEEIVEPSNECIGCICMGASLCDRERKCQHGFCGAFFIDKEYWKDAGSPTVNDGDKDADDAWKKCALDIYCAGQTVIEYMNKYKKDCNGDGVIDCRDYAMLHNLGPKCKGVIKRSFTSEFDSCYKMFFT